MANESNKTTEVLEFKVQQGDLINELEKTKRSILNLKDEQNKLNKSYKDGHITQEEYAKELVRVEAILKKQSSAYSDLQKKVTGVESSFDKLRKGLKEASNQINIAGVNVGSLTTKIASMDKTTALVVGTVGAATTVVSLLGAAYAKSAVGAEDLARATNRVKAFTDSFANSIGNKTGGGIFTSLAQFFTERAAFLTGIDEGQVNAAEAALNDLRDLELKTIDAAKIRKETEKEAENARRIRDSQTQKYQERLDQIAIVTEKLKENETQRVGVIDQQIQALLQYGENSGSILYSAVQQFETEKNINYELINGHDLKKQLKQLEAERADIQEEINGKLTENIAAEAAIRKEAEESAKAAAEKAKQLAIQTSELERQERIGKVEFETKLLQAKRLQQVTLANGKQVVRAAPDFDQYLAQFGIFIPGNEGLQELQEDVTKRIDITDQASDAAAKASEHLADKVEAANKRQAKSNKSVADSTNDQIDALRLFSSEAARLYQSINQDNKEFAALQLLLDSALTISGITKNAAELGPVAGSIYAAAAIASAGANLSQASKLIGSKSGFDMTGFQDFQGQVLTASDGRQYAIGKKGEVIPLNEQGDTSFVVTNRDGDTFDSREGTLRGALYRLAHPFKALRNLFAEGGYTGVGDKYQPAGIVHAGEVVWSQRDVAKVGGPAIANAMRPTYNGYADGGLVRAAPQFMSFQEAIALIRATPVILDYREFLGFENSFLLKQSAIQRRVGIRGI